ncbi:MAG: transglycosylase SLT domain-containing protein [Pseudomonadota bacterium]
MRCHALTLCLSLVTAPILADPVAVDEGLGSSPRPVKRDVYLPPAKWDFHPKGVVWTRATLQALEQHGRPLVRTVPGDIATWCPAYPANGPKQRAAFWNGFISSLVKYESTYKPRAVGGGGRWFGLTQILPGTARSYGCRAGTGETLKNGPANLSCAVRIMAKTVLRDGVVARKNGRRAGVGADWGPLSSRKKREEMAQFTRAQPYCRALPSGKRPIARPALISAANPED